MVQLVVDGGDPKSVRQAEDFLDIVEPIVVLDDETVLDSFRKATEILFEALECFFFIPIDATDMDDNFVSFIGPERGQDFIVVNQVLNGARDNVFGRRIQDGVLAWVQGDAHAAFADFGADAFEGFLVDFRPSECIDRTRTERNQIRTDSEQSDVVLAVVFDHPFQRGEVVRGHLRQHFRGRVFLHKPADVCVRGAVVQTGIADGHISLPFSQG